ncbi:hypothetical protein MHTCC0001_33970 [Flavobacteriaceae bacterium MHTCC 0001]
MNKNNTPNINRIISRVIAFISLISSIGVCMMNIITSNKSIPKHNKNNLPRYENILEKKFFIPISMNI